MSVPQWLEAFLWGLLSAASLPIGALCGLFAGAVLPEVVARIMGFGSGALVYAVTVQLYGKFLEHLDSDSDELVKNDYCEGMVAVFTGVLGALFYLGLNKYFVTNGSAGHQAEEKDRAGSTKMKTMPAITQSSKKKPPCVPPTSIGVSDASADDLEDQDAAEDTELMQGPVPQEETDQLEKIDHPCAEDKSVGIHASTAWSMWLGIALDGIPESLMLGFMTNGKRISWVFIMALFIANFPEAFSAAIILRQQATSRRKIFSMWASIFLMTGTLAMVGSLILPGRGPDDLVIGYASAAMEGLVGGAMLAMVSTAMLPEAFHTGGSASGFFFVCGFLVSVTTDYNESFWVIRGNRVTPGLLSNITAPSHPT